MVRESVRERLLDRRTEDGVLWPDYDGYSFHRTVPTTMAALGADVGPQLPSDAQPIDRSTVDRVLFLLIDGFGLDRWREHSDPLTARFDADGTVTPLTTVYPSETAAAIPSLHTATPPATHGSIGWDQYVDRADTVIQTLPFTAGDDDPADRGVTAADLFVGESVYGPAAEQGVDSEFVSPEGIVGLPSSCRFSEGATERRYYNVGDMAQRARRALEAGPDTFVYCYMPQVDHVAHQRGIASAEVRTQRRYLAHAVGAELLDRLDPTVAKRTLVAATADHGMYDTTGGTDLRELPAVWDNLRSRDCDRIPPVGGGRNVHLFLERGTLSTVRDALEATVACTTYTREETLDRGLFGPSPGDRIRERCGDLVVVPHEEITWHEQAKIDFVGMHGALTPEEMLVPFAVARASDLQR